jgi:D-serine deaminase-like pyridoxal phosphate-dependent protein
MTNIQMLDTPTLLVDHQKLLVNINEIANYANQQGVAYRPHIKTHKSVKIAQLQVEAGAVGITTAKISEAEVMASGGIKDILIAYPISNPDKINRLIQLLQKGVRLKVAVDNPESTIYIRSLDKSQFWSQSVWSGTREGSSSFSKGNNESFQA